MTHSTDDSNEEDREFLRSLLEFVSSHPDKEAAMVCIEATRTALAISEDLLTQHEATRRVADQLQMLATFLVGWADKVNFRLDCLEKSLGVSYRTEYGSPLFPESQMSKLFRPDIQSVIERLERVEQASDATRKRQS